MRVLLAQNSPYYPAHGGGDKSNRLLLEALAARGHQCVAVARIAAFGDREHAAYLRELEARGVRHEERGGVVIFSLHGVEVHVATRQANLRGYFAGQIGALQPDAILASTDDPAQLLLEAALKSHAPVIYLARAPLALPFGPESAFPSDAKTATLRQTDLLVGVSEYVARYVREHSGIPAVHVPISLMDPGPWPDLGRFDNEFVTLVNPCAVKGIAILLGLADRMPATRFAAVPTWGTNEQDRAALAAHPNITVLDPVDRIDTLLARTRALLVPSLWAEARSRIVVESLLRGVPVLAANVGGIPEAMMGLDYLLPVRPIERYEPRLDENMVPQARVPRQDLAPWEDALRELLGSPERYESLSRRSRETAIGYAERATVEPFETLLEEVRRRPRARRTETQPGPGSDPLHRLSPEKRRLLELKLRKAATELWFPGAAAVEPGRLRLFCFPHAGGGAAWFQAWQPKLPAGIAVCPVRTPGREVRAGEPAFTDMSALVAAIGDHLRPFTAEPFAFFGHSMGAAIAFETARWLRRHGLPGPSVLIASAARAPQFRRDWTPPPMPPDDEFIAQLRRLQGMPREVLDKPELMKVLLPRLKADAELYRNYHYTEEPPLPCPIRALGGVEDPNIQYHHLEAWAEQTAAAGFAVTLFPGGHFYLMTNQREFLAALETSVA